MISYELYVFIFLILFCLIIIFNFFFGVEGGSDKEFGLSNFFEMVYDWVFIKVNKTPCVRESSKGEGNTKKAVEKIFNKEFKKVRPDFLLNEVTGRKLELDLYNEELKLAVEYNGEQHYKFSPRFHKNKDQFHTQLYRDKEKQRLCKENGVDLIIVPYTEKDIYSFLKKEVEKRKLKSES